MDTASQEQIIISPCARMKKMASGCSSNDDHPNGVAELARQFGDALAWGCVVFLPF